MFTPHELGYHLSSRVDFEKGCYTGQEIVARMHYRAKKLPSLLVKSSSTFLEDYSKVFDANKTAIGIILSSIKHGESFHNLLSMNKNFENQEFEI
jgi:folate-binding Fe-S cluster repair protein YgfZ